MEYQENTLRWEDYLALRASVGWAGYSQAQIQKALDGSRYTVTAVDEGQAVGMGRLIGDGLYYVLADIAVHPMHQGKGIGTKIVDMLLRHAENETPAGGRASVQLISEAGRESFYEAMGFERIPNGSCGSGMKKTICK